MSKFGRTYVLSFMAVLFFSATASTAHNRYHTPLKLSAPCSERVYDLSVRVIPKASSVTTVLPNLPAMLLCLYSDRAEVISETPALIGKDFKLSSLATRAPPLRFS
jgi:hypothetical protein